MEIVPFEVESVPFEVLQVVGTLPSMSCAWRAVAEGRIKAKAQSIRRNRRAVGKRQDMVGC
jgi:hypothetical protein